MPHATPTARTDAGSPGKLDKAEREAETVRLARIVQASEPGSREWIEARNGIVELHRMLPRWMAGQYRTPRRLERCDLQQAGHLGLIRAAERFDPNRGKVFASYAGIWIRRRFQDYEAEHGALIRVPWNAKNADGTQCRPHETVSLPDNDQNLWMLARPGNAHAIDDEELLRAVFKVVYSELSDGEIDLLRMRYGIDGREPLSLPEIGRRLGVAYQAPQQRINRIMSKLRKHLEPLYDQLREDVA